MENEIKVNEFVRTKDGQIYKIEDGTEFYEDSVNVGIGIIPDVDGIWVDKEHFTYVDKREIVKHSSNLIDLIEVNDICIMSYNGIVFQKFVSRDDIVALKLKEYKLLEILTKEQFESISYKVERN